MDSDEKTFRVIDSLQQGIKAVADFGVRGVLVYLAITAYSFTFAFENSGRFRSVVCIGNIIVGIFATAGFLFVGKTLNKKRKQLINLYADVDVDIGSDVSKTSSLSWTTLFCALLSVVVIVLWTLAIWIPGPDGVE